MHWFLDPITKHYLDFEGRATRQQFWMFQLFLIVVLLAIVLSAGTLYALMMMPLIAGGVMLACLLPSIALQVRRLHDIGKSGWWIFLGFIPYIGSLMLLVMYCLPSQAGTNKWGVNPYGVVAPVDMAPAAPAPVAAPAETTAVPEASAVETKS
jgi:uncharacterized membrane protein YhaH (DUF805 family)